VSIAKITFKSAVAHECFLVEAKCLDAHSEKESSLGLGSATLFMIAILTSTRRPAVILFSLVYGTITFH